MSWYYATGDQRMGPVSDEELVRLAERGAIQGRTLVWREGMADWVPLGQAHPEALARAGMDAVAQAACVDCGRTFPADEMVAFEGVRVCADCKPAFFQRIREGAPLGSELRYAGFWIRFCARLVDALVSNVLFAPITLLQIYLYGGFNEYLMGASEPREFLIAGIFMLVGVVAMIFYEGWTTARYGGTPGKLIVGLRVVRPDGAGLTFKRATGRYFGTWLSFLTLYIGFLMAAFDDEKRALHDRVCDTRVIYK